MNNSERVIIAGAGPVGLVSAMCLANEGIPVLVIEMGDQLPIDLRASTFHPPTLDMLDKFGITSKLIEAGLTAPTWQYRDRESGERAEFDLGLISDRTAHPYRVQCEQHKMTRMILSELESNDLVEVLFSTKVIDVYQDSDFVYLSVENNGEKNKIKGKYAIAADGANSAIRQSLNLGFEGVTYPEWFVQATTPFEFRDYIPNLSLINYVSDSNEWFVLLRVVGNWRCLFPSREGEKQEDAISEDSLQKRINGILERNEKYHLTHKTIYRIHQRVATTYNVGKIFLAGDSAHLNNPLGGMGMNGGIHDAVNLTEKLTKVWKKTADDSLFDLYTKQRQPVAVESVQAQAERNRQLLNERDRETRLARFKEMQSTANNQSKARSFLLKSSMIESLEKAARIQ